MSKTDYNLQIRAKRIYEQWKTTGIEKLILPKEQTETQEEYQKKLEILKEYVEEIKSKLKGTE